MVVMGLNDLHYPSILFLFITIPLFIICVLLYAGSNVPANGSWGAWV